MAAHKRLYQRIYRNGIFLTSIKHGSLVAEKAMCVTTSASTVLTQFPLFTECGSARVNRGDNARKRASEGEAQRLHLPLERARARRPRGAWRARCTRSSAAGRGTAHPVYLSVFGRRPPIFYLSAMVQRAYGRAAERSAPVGPAACVCGCGVRRCGRTELSVSRGLGTSAAVMGVYVTGRAREWPARRGIRC